MQNTIKKKKFIKIFICLNTIILIFCLKINIILKGIGELKIPLHLEVTDASEKTIKLIKE